METVRIAFCTNSNVGSRLIELATWSRWSHVCILDDSTGTIIEAVGSGVRETSLRKFLSGKRRVEVVTMYVRSRAQTVAFARAQIGKRYDFSALLGILFKRDWEETDKWFCSELVAASLAASDSSPFRADLTGRITPGDLWRVNPQRMPL